MIYSLRRRLERIEGRIRRPVTGCGVLVCLTDGFLWNGVKVSEPPPAESPYGYLVVPGAYDDPKAWEAEAVRVIAESAKRVEELFKSMDTARDEPEDKGPVFGSGGATRGLSGHRPVRRRPRPKYWK